MDEQLLIKFLTHTCTSEDVKLVDQWITSDKANANWLFEIERIWSLKDELQFSDKREIEKAYKYFVSFSGIKKKKLSYKHFPLYSLIGHAVAILIIALLSFNVYKYYNKDIPHINTIEVPNGQRILLTLSDGTKVWLNSQSKLIYPGQFSNKKRTVCLEGEAYFDVAHNPSKPFTVKSNQLNTKVLGTKFNMRVYTAEEAIITLIDGKVEVETTDQENKIILKPNEQLIYTQDGRVQKKYVTTDIVTAWTQGEAAFVNESLSDICRRLERKFDVKISITDPQLAKEHFTCRFKESATVGQVLDLLKETRRLDYMIDKDHITIYKLKKNSL